MLQAIDIGKRFEGREVLRHVNLHLAPGDHVSLMGPSGCGKSTLLHILMGLIKPDSGTVHRAPITTLSAVFQEDRLLPHLSAIQNIALVSPAPQEAITALLGRLGIEPESLSLPVSAFSGGMKRRVALARALLADSNVLLLDEPYQGLDEAARDNAIAIVNEMTQNKAVLLVTHSKEETIGYRPFSLA